MCNQLSEWIGPPCEGGACRGVGGGGGADCAQVFFSRLRIVSGEEKEGTLVAKAGADWGVGRFRRGGVGRLGGVCGACRKGWEA